MNGRSRQLYFAATLFLLPGAVWSQSAAPEYWEGSRSNAGKSQALVMRVEHSGSSSKASVDLPEFGALSIPAAAFSMGESKVHFELIGDASNAVFEGKLAAGAIRGTWNEGAQGGEFQLRRGQDTRAGVREEAVSFPSGEVRLAGTLLLPAEHNPAAAIVFVQGAGPETRNASRFLAEFFVKLGVAALIYDKRGAGASTGDWKHSSFDDLAGDAVEAVNYLKSRREVDPLRIGLMGTSQGGWIAPMAAVRSADVHFVIAKSAAGVDPEEQELARLEMQMRSDGNRPEDIKEAVELYRQMIAYARTGHGWEELVGGAEDRVAKELV
jgi:alpha/beta superfamily hydrolase